MPNIRKANLPDAEKLAVLAVSTFRESFAEQNSVEDIEAHCRSSYGEAIQAAEIASPDYVTQVVEENQQLVAFTQLRWGDPPECVVAKSPGEIHRFYVDKAWHGKRLASELMVACLDEMDKRKVDVVWLGVWEQNLRAISFYKKFSFAEVGEHVFLVQVSRYAAK